MGTGARRPPAADVIVVGRVGGPYGVKGWVRITSYTEPRENLLEYRPWWIRRPDGWRELVVEECEVRGDSLLACFADCHDRDQAALLRGRELGVRPESLPGLADGEYYWRQLIGLAVIDLAERRLGRVERMMATGANDVLVVRGDEGSLDRRERLIPFLLDSVIRAVDLERGLIQVDWDPEF